MCPGHVSFWGQYDPPKEDAAEASPTLPCSISTWGGSTLSEFPKELKRRDTQVVCPVSIWKNASVAHRWLCWWPCRTPPQTSEAWWKSVSSRETKLTHGDSGGCWMWRVNNWLVVWNMAVIFPSYWECHHPNWRTHIFQRGGSTTNQSFAVAYYTLW